MKRIGGYALRKSVRTAPMRLINLALTPMSWSYASFAKPVFVCNWGPAVQPTRDGEYKQPPLVHLRLINLLLARNRSSLSIAIALTISTLKYIRDPNMAVPNIG